MSIAVSLIAFDTGVNTDFAGGSNPSAENANFYIATTGEPINDTYKFECQLLLNAKIYLAVPASHRFAKRVGLDLAEAKDEWFVNSPINTSFRAFCDNLCREAGFVPKSRIECDYILRPRMLLNENMVCLATSIGQYSGLYDGIVMIPIVNPVRTRPQAIYWRSGAYLFKSALIFRDFMIDYCSKL